MAVTFAAGFFHKVSVCVEAFIVRLLVCGMKAAFSAIITCAFAFSAANITLFTCMSARDCVACYPVFAMI
jgi:hypothetical protein